jgi:hypothetical protein
MQSMWIALGRYDLIVPWQPRIIQHSQIILKCRASNSFVEKNERDSSVYFGFCSLAVRGNFEETKPWQPIS